MKKDPKAILETCHHCGFRNHRKEMYHMQLGFNSIWKCKARTKCAKRPKVLHGKQTRRITKDRPLKRAKR